MSNSIEVTVMKLKCHFARHIWPCKDFILINLISTNILCLQLLPLIRTLSAYNNKNTNHKIKHTKKIWNDKVEKYLLPAVRIKNPAGLRRFFYLPHPSSLPLPSLDLVGRKWGCRGKGWSFIFEEGACRPAGGRQAPSSNIKLQPFPLRPHFLPTRSREGRGRVSEVIPPAKPCRILDPNRR